MVEQLSESPRLLNRLNDTLRREVLPILGRLPAYGRLLYALASSPDLTPGQKTALVLALGYQVSPIDLIPGFIPVIGQLDDLYVLLWGIRRTLDALPPEHAQAYLEKAGLTSELLEADTLMIRRALGETLSRSARAAQRGIATVLRAGIMATAFLGYFLFYTARGRR